MLWWMSMWGLSKFFWNKFRLDFFSRLYPLASFSKLVYVVACYAIRYVCIIELIVVILLPPAIWITSVSNLHNLQNTVWAGFFSFYSMTWCKWQQQMRVMVYNLVANLCDALDCFKSNVNMFRFKHFSNFNYWKLNWL